MLRFPVLFLMLFFPGVLGTIVLRKMVILSSWLIGEAVKVEPCEGSGSPLGNFSYCGKKSDLTFVLNAGI